MNIYDFKVKTKSGEEKSLGDFRGKILLIVNTASKCGFTPQYKELQSLYEKYENEKFEILAFPCNQFANQEPGNDDEIAKFCSINYGVTFPVFAKINVNGPKADPLFKYLCENHSGILGGKIKWNFTKFLIDADGNIVDRYAPVTSPLKIENIIKKLIEKIM